MNSKVILVDLKDNQIGTMDKMDAHVNGVLHRAFSVLIFNDNGEILLQQRALHKYHSGGLWTNTCCSHPFPGEEIIDAGKRRLFEEMGFKCELTSIGSFTYQFNTRDTFGFAANGAWFETKEDCGCAEGFQGLCGNFEDSTEICNNKKQFNIYKDAFPEKWNRFVSLTE